LAPDTAAITGSPESAAAAAPAPTKLTKSLRFNVVLTPLIIDEQHRQKRACDQWRCSTKYSVIGSKAPKLLEIDPALADHPRHDGLTNGADLYLTGRKSANPSCPQSRVFGNFTDRSKG
jgi:hypothetical protein